MAATLCFGSRARRVASPASSPPSRWHERIGFTSRVASVGLSVKALVVPRQARGGHAMVRPESDAGANDTGRGSAAGARNTIEDLYREYGAVVLREAREVLGARAEAGSDAQDVLHQVFARLLARSGDSQLMKLQGGFFRRAGRNEALHALEREHTRERLAPALRAATSSEPPEAPDSQIERVEQASAVRKAVAALSPRCREALLLVYWEGLTHREAALQMGVTEKVLAKHIARGHARLRRNEHLALVYAGHGDSDTGATVRGMGGEIRSHRLMGCHMLANTHQHDSPDPSSLGAMVALALCLTSHPIKDRRVPHGYVLTLD